jgi:hypothetical protein
VGPVTVSSADPEPSCQLTEKIDRRRQHGPGVLAGGVDGELAWGSFGHAQRGRIGATQHLEALPQQRQTAEAGSGRIEHHVAHGRNDTRRQGGKQQHPLHHQPHLARQQDHRSFGAGGAHACGSGG